VDESGVDRDEKPRRMFEATAACVKRQRVGEEWYAYLHVFQTVLLADTPEYILLAALLHLSG
jgi:hypothetical protein